MPYKLDYLVFIINSHDVFNICIFFGMTVEGDIWSNVPREKFVSINNKVNSILFLEMLSSNYIHFFNKSIIIFIYCAATNE